MSSEENINAAKKLLEITIRMKKLHIEANSCDVAVWNQPI